LKPKEARRVHVMELLVAGKLTVSEAAQLLGLSERQVKRLKKGVSEQGIGFLAHKNRGRKPKHALPEEVRHFVVRLAQEELKGASCVHMAELLTEFYGITVSDRTIRRALRQARIANPHSRKAPRKRRCRQRMPKAGFWFRQTPAPLPGWKNAVRFCPSRCNRRRHEYGSRSSFPAHRGSGGLPPYFSPDGGKPRHPLSLLQRQAFSFLFP